jgi:hypothetical protein
MSYADVNGISRSLTRRRWSRLRHMHSERFGHHGDLTPVG